MKNYKEEYTAEATESKTKKKVSTILLASFFAIHLVFFHTMVFSRLINNEADYEQFEYIYNEITEYERESGKKISKVVIYYDKQLTHANPGVLLIGDCNVRALSRHWSDVNLIKALSGRWFNRSYDDKDINPQYKAYFESQDWSTFADEQFIFDGTTLHLCVY